jgi:hypothetical protein
LKWVFPIIEKEMIVKVSFSFESCDLSKPLKKKQNFRLVCIDLKHGLLRGGKNMNQNYMSLKIKCSGKHLNLVRMKGEWSVQGHLITRIFLVYTGHTDWLCWAVHVTRMEETRNTYRIFAEISFGKHPLGRPRRGWYSNIEMHVREIIVRMRDERTISKSVHWLPFVLALLNLTILLHYHWLILLFSDRASLHYLLNVGQCFSQFVLLCSECVLLPFQQPTFAMLMFCIHVVSSLVLT